MDAVKFLNERARLCNTYKDCAHCPAHLERCIFRQIVHGDAKQQIEVVEKWVAAHPVNTRQSVFLEQYPQADIDTRGVLAICPNRISAEHRIRIGVAGCMRIHCAECRREFWTQEV